MNIFSSIFGNEPIKAYLEKALQQNCLPQTLLFSGPEGVGKSLFAKALAAHLLKSPKENPPDLHIYRPEGKSGLYAIDTVRELIEEEHAAPFEAPHKVFILENAERMQPASANALLKTLEEPSPDTTFILLTSAPKDILPTILSRCVILSFQPLPEESIATLLKKAGHPESLAKLSHGSAGRAFELALHSNLEEMRKILFGVLAATPDYPALSSSLEKLESFIEEGKEEDPVRASRFAEHLFSQILMWHRDQHLRKLGVGEEFLFFPEEPPISRSTLPLEKVEKALDTARTAYQRNMKLSVCLESIFVLN